MLNQLIGTGAALVTPFHRNLEINYEELGKLLHHTAENGVDYWVVMGTTGESVTLNAEERASVLAYVKTHNPKQLPIVYGIGGNHTKEILETLQKTDLEGVSAILSVSPYYNKPTQEGIYVHFRTIADHSPVPVILYNVPSRTSSNMSAFTTLRLAEHSNIIGIKEASGDLMQCMEIARYMPEDFLLISGDDMLTLPMIAFGAKGVISVLANALPLPFTQMVDACLENQFEKASQLLFDLLDINKLMYEEGNPVGVKKALELLNICGNYVRLPLVEASDVLTARIKDTLGNLQARSL